MVDHTFNLSILEAEAWIVYELMANLGYKIHLRQWDPVWTKH